MVATSIVLSAMCSQPLVHLLLCTRIRAVRHGIGFRTPPPHPHPPPPPLPPSPRPPPPVEALKPADCALAYVTAVDGDVVVMTSRGAQLQSC